mgnify:CR=1 FL=1
MVSLCRLESLQVVASTFTNLTFLTASFNKLTGKIFDMNVSSGIFTFFFSLLTSLYTLSSNTDVSAISSLTSLTYLDVSHNRITSLNPLSSMRSLKTLRCNNNNLVDMEVMSRLLSLEELWLNNNQIGTVLAAHSRSL